MDEYFTKIKSRDPDTDEQLIGNFKRRLRNKPTELIQKGTLSSGSGPIGTIAWRRGGHDRRRKDALVLLRASTVVGDRVPHLDDILEDRFFTALQSLFFEKDDPLQTRDEEFEGGFMLIMGHSLHSKCAL